jgi:transcriptional regulator
MPKVFVEEDVTLLHDLVDAHSFGLLAVPGAGGAPPMFAHLPFLLDRRAGPRGTLLGHVARANPIRAALDGRTPLVAVFRGPHGYVSPAWYTSRDDVPTWNYAVVHAHGVARPIDDEGDLRALLGRLAAANEGGGPGAWSTAEVSAETWRELLPAIVGFAIEITSLEGKLKLSQNRPAADRDGAIRGVEARGGPDDASLAALMRRANAE